MDKEQGFRYKLEGKNNLEEFAKGILLLTNLKGTGQGVLHIKTYTGTNLVQVVTDVENDSYLESYVGDIKSKERIDILTVDYEDLNTDAQEQLEKAEDKMLDEDVGYYVSNNI